MSDLKITSIQELIMISMLHQPRYGLEIIELVSDASKGQVQLHLGTLYPAIESLARKQLIKKRVSPHEHDVRNNHARKYYQITEEGRRLLSEIEDLRQALILSR